MQLTLIKWTMLLKVIIAIVDETWRTYSIGDNSKLSYYIALQVVWLGHLS